MNKKLYLLVVLFFTLAVSAGALDTIILINGNTINAKVEEISPTQIKYRRADNLSGPLIIINRSDVSVIKYENGTVDTITPDTKTPEQQAAAAVTKDGSVSSFTAIVFAGNGHSYEVIDKSMNWTKAKEDCEKRGGYLATITSEEEQNFIQDLIKKGKSNSYWLGGYREGKDWKWVTGEDFTYKKWASGQPDNSGGEEDKLDLYKSWGSWGGYWNDNNKNNTTGYICEWDTSDSIKSGETRIIGQQTAKSSSDSDPNKTHFSLSAEPSGFLVGGPSTAMEFTKGSRIFSLHANFPSLARNSNIDGFGIGFGTNLNYFWGGPRTSGFLFGGLFEWNNYPSIKTVNKSSKPKYEKTKANDFIFGLNGGYKFISKSGIFLRLGMAGGVTLSTLFPMKFYYKPDIATGYIF